MSSMNLTTAFKQRQTQTDPGLDWLTLGTVAALLLIGLVMLTSASVTLADQRLGDATYYLSRQGVYIVLGCLLGLAMWHIKLSLWERQRNLLLLLGVISLTLVLVPGIGREVNGSMRWISLGGFNLQPSEFVKIAVIFYMAGYMVRHGQSLAQSAQAWLRPLGLVAVIGFALMAEPDFGATAVIAATCIGMLYLGGMRLSHFIALITLAGGGAGYLILSSPYRLQRMLSFMDPWSDPFGSGFQLTQALIAFGRGDWLGVGLGGSVQKLFYLPEAHTDFLFAVLAEELGALGALLVIVLFALLIWRAFKIGAQAERVGLRFAAYSAYGIGLSLGLQAFINMGVNMGLLPTKGLTLPLMSYGGSSLVASLMMVGLLLRVDRETRAQDQRQGQGRWR